MANSFVLGRVDGGQEAVTAAGTAIATATALDSMINIVTTASGEVGVKLPQGWPVGTPVVVNNVGTTTLAAVVYPPTTAGVINGTASFSVAADKGAVFYAHTNGLDWTGVGG